MSSIIFPPSFKSSQICKKNKTKQAAAKTEISVAAPKSCNNLSKGASHGLQALK